MFDCDKIDFNFNEFIQYVFNNLSEEKRAGFLLKLRIDNKLFLYKKNTNIKSLEIDGEEILELIKLSVNEILELKDEFIEKKITEDYEYRLGQRDLNQYFNSVRM